MKGEEVSLPLAANANVTRLRQCVKHYSAGRGNKSNVLGEQSVWRDGKKCRVLTIRLTSKRGVWPGPAKTKSLKVFGP